VVDCCPLLGALISDGPTRPLGYPRAETPLEENPQALPHRVRPGREAFPLDRDGSAGSVDIDSGPSMAATFGPTVTLVKEEVAATGATLLGSIAILARPLCFRPGVVESHRQQRKSSSNATHYFFIIPNKNGGDN